MKYTMNPINNGTRLRKDHNTYSGVISSYNAGQLIEGDEIWEAPADGLEVKKGDKWLRVISVDGIAVSEIGWMAYIHKSSPICNNFKSISDNDNGGSISNPVFPDSFTLIESNGKKAEYFFVRIIE